MNYRYKKAEIMHIGITVIMTIIAEQMMLKISTKINGFFITSRKN